MREAERPEQSRERTRAKISQLGEQLETAVTDHEKRLIKKEIRNLEKKLLYERNLGKPTGNYQPEKANWVINGWATNGLHIASLLKLITRPKNRP